MKKFFRISLAVSAASAGLLLFTPAHAQSAPPSANEIYQKELLEKAFRGKQEAFEVSYLFANCYAFQNELFKHFTREVELDREDITLFSAMANQSLEAGYISALIIEKYEDNPGEFVNHVARDTRSTWAPKVIEMDDTVWEELGKCIRIMPVGQAFVERSQSRQGE